MTADEFTDLLSKLVGDAEQAGLSSEEVLDVLEVMAEVIRAEDVVPSPEPNEKGRAAARPGCACGGDGG